ncbi:MAG: hypothetical protein ABI823_14595, partial [Bryobacteraceae bacterium]
MLFLIPGLMLAHPMGNFSVSHYTHLEVRGQGIEARYVLDLAEVPTFEVLRDWKLGAKSSRAELLAKGREQMRTWAGNLEFRANGRSVPAAVEEVDLALTDGAAGLPVMRISARLSVDAPAGELTFEDHNYAERAGWKEIVIAVSAGGTLSKASQSSEERSQALTAYPADPLAAPPQDLRAALTWTA